MCTNSHYHDYNTITIQGTDCYIITMQIDTIIYIGCTCMNTGYVNWLISMTNNTTCNSMTTCMCLIYY